MSMPSWKQYGLFRLAPAFGFCAAVLAVSAEEAPKADAGAPPADSRPAASSESAPAVRDLKNNLCGWEALSWGDLNAVEQQTWAVLGWQSASWDGEAGAQRPASELKEWAELTPAEQESATKLGYDQASWNSINCPE